MGRLEDARKAGIASGSQSETSIFGTESESLTYNYLVSDEQEAFEEGFKEGKDSQKG